MALALISIESKVAKQLDLEEQQHLI